MWVAQAVLAPTVHLEGPDKVVMEMYQLILL
jgi:hypothetical protein